LAVGAVYTSKTHSDVLNVKHGRQPFLAALKFCVDEHPLLSTVILKANTESPEFATPTALDLNAHLEIRDAGGAPEDTYIERLLAQISDEQFHSLHTTPPWKVILVSLPQDKESRASRLLVLFTNYHSHGDGRSGLAFQNSFHAGLLRHLRQTDQSEIYIGPICEAPATALLPPIEEGGKLTLSWSCLLSPLLGTYLPKSFVSFLGLRDSWLSSEADIWRGKDTTFDPGNHSTGLVLVTIESSTISQVLQHCRAKGTTFTGLLEHLIARALTASDGGAVGTSTFNAGVAVDMRHLFPGVYSSASMMNCVTGHSEMIQYDHSQEEHDWAIHPSSRYWEAARKTTASLRLAASTLHNQPIGLLQYLKAFRPWTTGLIGKERDMSFEISNLGAFSPVLPDKDAGYDLSIEKLVFSQPAKASGSLLDFNPVSVNGGPLVMTITWQLGVLGLSEGMGEAAFVRKVCSKLESSIREIAAVPL
jgi:hypothetical protein